MALNIRRIGTLLLTALLALGSVALHAEGLPSGTDVAAPGPGGKQLVLTALDTFQSQPGETKEVFLKRVGVYMQHYSAQNQVETCASIWESADQAQFALQVFTTHSHIECLIVTQNTTGVAGLAQDEATIHSHPLVREVKINEVDALLTGKPVGTKEELFNATFSQPDKDAGPGYLVANRHLQYQKDGGKTYQDFGPLAE